MGKGIALANSKHIGIIDLLKLNLSETADPLFSWLSRAVVLPATTVSTTSSNGSAMIADGVNAENYDFDDCISDCDASGPLSPLARFKI
jgi:hypothetical protein